MARTRRQQAPISWYDAAEEVPNPAAPSGQKLAKSQKWYRRLAMSSVVLTPAAMLVTILAVAHSSVPATSQAPAGTAPGEAVAQLAVERWLSSSPSPLPHGRILFFSGASPVPVAKVSRQSGAASKVTWTAEDESFVLSANGSTYTASVEVVFPPGNRTGVANASPSLSPQPGSPPNPAAQTGPWPGVTASASAPAPVVQAVQGWAQAYTSGSASSLRLAVGDTSASDHFIPLHGVSQVTSSVSWSAPLASAGEMVANVSLTLVWNHQQAPSQYQTTVPQVTMDLLIERANTPAPVVVAWGPSGGGPSLTPFQNAR